ncbi:hypothetical protein ACH5RR_001974, partial [Cinchona calisaya]
FPTPHYAKLNDSSKQSFGKPKDSLKSISPTVVEAKVDSRDTRIASPALDDWSPPDDDIEVKLPYSSSNEKKIPSKEDINAHIKAVLYGYRERKRLPFFMEVYNPNSDNNILDEDSM